MNPAQSISSIISKILKDEFSIEFSSEIIEKKIETPKDKNHGDLAVPCFLFAKDFKKPPVQIANELEPHILSAIESDPNIESYNKAGPYLNFFVSSGFLTQILDDILNGKALQTAEAKQERVMIEYSQPNTHKSFHVGHMRNVALGDSLGRMYRHCGYDVVSANYIGDEGTHIAKCLWAYQNHNDEKAPENNRGEYLGRLYQKADNLLDMSSYTKLPIPGVISVKVMKIEKHPSKDNLSIVQISNGNCKETVVCGGKGFSENDIVAYAPIGIRFAGRLIEEKDIQGATSRGMILSEKEMGLDVKDKEQIFIFPSDTILGREVTEIGRKDSELDSNQNITEVITQRQKEVSETLKQLEDKGSDIQQLWRETKDWSMEDFKSIYTWIDCHFDHYFYESEVGQDGKDMVVEAHKAGTLVESEGAIGVDLQKDKLGFFLLLKSDGTGLYSTKDLALAKRKFEEFKIDRSIYVVDFSQSLHFSQVFKTLEKLGFEQAKHCFHLAYGLVTLPGGEKMSTRKGTVILFSELKDKLSSHIKSEFLEKHKDEWSEEEIETACRRIAIATIKYGMLNQDNLKDIAFDINEWTATTGNTGPYLLYAYARTKSIEREVGVSDEKPDWSFLTDEYEKHVLTQLNKFQETVSRATENNRPQAICIYLYDLAKSFSRMFDNCHVKNAETTQLQQSRLGLVRATGLVLKKGLELIGIETIERM